MVLRSSVFLLLASAVMYFADLATGCPTTNVIDNTNGLVPSLDYMQMQSWWGTPESRLDCTPGWAAVGPTGPHGCGRVFDRQAGREGENCFITQQNPPTGYVGYNFAVPTIVRRLSVQQSYSVGHEAHDFVFEGGNGSGSDWTHVYTATMRWNEATPNAICQTDDFSFDNSHAYNAYRVVFTTPTSQQGTGVCELQMYGAQCLHDGAQPQTPSECAQASTPDGQCYAVWNSTQPGSFQCKPHVADFTSCADILTSEMKFSDHVECGGSLFSKADMEAAVTFLNDAETGTASDSGSAAASCAVPVYWRPALNGNTATLLTALPPNSIQWSVFPELAIGLILDPVTGVVQGSALVAALSNITHSVSMYVSVQPDLAVILGMTNPHFTRSFALTFPALTTTDCTDNAPLAQALGGDIPVTRFSQVERWCAVRKQYADSKSN